MKTALVGYTGFVGSNLEMSKNFTYKFNSQNIGEAYGLEPDILIYAGVRAEKFLANANPEKDRKSVMEAFENIKKIQPRKLILISTIDVYKKPEEVDENTVIDIEGLQPYGVNRFLLEECIREEFPKALIVRLPGLFGINIKKNFIYDFIHVIPSLLSEEKYKELFFKEQTIQEFYELQDNGFYKCKKLCKNEKNRLKIIYKKLGFSALNFTDSRGMFQFYPLHRLWGDIEKALDTDLRLLNVATEPISISDLYQVLTGKNFTNYLAKEIPKYDFRSIHASLYNGANGYLYNKDEILNEIKKFVQEQL